MAFLRGGNNNRTGRAPGSRLSDRSRTWSRPRGCAAVQAAWRALRGGSESGRIARIPRLPYGCRSCASAGRRSADMTRMPRWLADLFSVSASAGCYDDYPGDAVLYCTVRGGPEAYGCSWSVSMTHRTFAWAWLVVLCLVASSASGMIADRNIVWWVLGGVLAPAMLVMVVARVMRPGPAAAMAGDKG